MKDLNGWIKLHRRILKWEWYSDLPTRVVFLHLLLKANHEVSTWQGIEIGVGELVTGRKILAKECGISEQSVRTALANLQSTRNLTIKSTNKYSIVKLNNYNLYQAINQQANQQSTTNKKIRNKEYNTILDFELGSKVDTSKKDSLPPKQPPKELNIYFKSFRDECLKRHLEIDVPENRYLEFREEYHTKILFWDEIKKCLAWCYDNEKRKINIPRLRNWMTNAIRFQKEREIKTMQNLKEKKEEKKIVLTPKRQPLWTPPL